MVSGALATLVLTTGTMLSLACDCLSSLSTTRPVPALAVHVVLPEDAEPDDVDPLALLFLLPLSLQAPIASGTLIASAAALNRVARRRCVDISLPPSVSREASPARVRRASPALPGTLTAGSDTVAS